MVVNNTEIRKLNSLRGLAALIVVVSHFSNEMKLFNGMMGEGAGQFGVMLFFLLSGFLMSHLYMDRNFEPKAYVGFAIARIGRVIPLYLVVVLISFISVQLFSEVIVYNIPDIYSVLSHLFMLSGVSVLWTIPPEIQFYALFIVLWWLYSKKPGFLFFLVGLIIFILFLLDFPRPTGKKLGFTIDVSILRSLPYFLSGMMMGLLYSRWKPSVKSHYVVLVLGLIPFLYPKVFESITGFEHRTWQDISILLCMSWIFFLVVFFVPDNNRLLANKVGDFLGKISYSLYLLHMPILIALKLQISDVEYLFAIFIMLSILVAYASYSLIESPCRKAVRKLVRHPV
jgi:peptidoglycan/LPS O-acetylase OafA/YrhL